MRAVLVLDTSRGVVVVTGCAHPGLGTSLAAAAGFGLVSFTA